MTAFYESPSELPILQASLPFGWEVISELQVEERATADLTFSFPVPDNIRWAEIYKPLATHIHGHTGYGIPALGAYKRKIDYAEWARFVEIDMNWPLPDDIIDRLKYATELIVDACID